jgi:hypothetical protein
MCQYSTCLLYSYVHAQISYVLGATVLLDWALELQRRNEVFEAIDHVLVDQGLKVSVYKYICVCVC